MKTGNKIALFYTAITIGIISVVTVVFYFVATDYIHGELSLIHISEPTRH